MDGRDWPARDSVERLSGGLPAIPAIYIVKFGITAGSAAG